MAKQTFHTLYCGGRSPKTGKKVGKYHRWGLWGGVKPCAGMQCVFCGRFYEDVRVPDSHAKGDGMKRVVAHFVTVSQDDHSNFGTM